jgi:hypothetical protein
VILAVQICNFAAIPANHATGSIDGQAAPQAFDRFAGKKTGPDEAGIGLQPDLSRGRLGKISGPKPHEIACQFEKLLVAPIILQSRKPTLRGRF